MKISIVRVLCVDSCDARREKLTEALENCGVEVWAARDIRDAMPLLEGLSPDAILVDQASTLKRGSEWERLISSDLKIPALVHSAPADAWPAIAGEVGLVRTQDPEVIVAILTLLLGPGGRSSPALQKQYVA